MEIEKKMEILYDHYKDTFENLKIYLQRRNVYTLISLVLIAFLSFHVSSPEEAVKLSNELIKTQIGESTIDFLYLNNVLVFAILWVVILYYQINLLIEKQYSYIYEIEELLSKDLSPFSISRESKTYLTHYPLLSEVVHRIYTIIFPIGLILVAVIKWVSDKNMIVTPWENGHFWFNMIILIGIIFTSLLYLSNRHFNDFRKKEKPAADTA